jgi:pimeloyl-ACP methyl ester carboxylesterase
MWDPQWAMLAAGHRVVRYDLRGYGQSTIPPEPFAHHDDLLALMDALALESATIVGASMGGEVALALALDHPQRVDALVLINTLAGMGTPSDGLRAGWREMGEAFDRGDLDAAVEIELRMWVDGPHRQPAEVDPALRDVVRAMDLALLQRAAEQDAAAEREPDPPLIDRLEAVSCPVLVITGLLDQPDALTSAGTLVARIPQATRVDVPGAAHLPSLEQPVAVNRALAAFLASRHR